MRNHTKCLLAALTAIALVTGSSNAAPIIYEPFDDTNATLQGNTVGTGLTGTWTSTGAFAVIGTSLSYGGQPTSGGSVQYVTPDTNSGNINAVASTLTGGATPGSLENAGLLAHGAELWFSVMNRAVNTSDDRAAFALATGTLTSNTNFGAADYGIGFAISNTGSLTARVSTAGTTHVNGTGVGRFTLPETTLIVGRITWGADALTDDTVQLYLPDTNLNLGTVQSTAAAIIDQSAFDVVTIFSRRQAGTNMGYDEIRFGATVGDVLPVPEPGSLALTGLGGLCGLGFLCRRRRAATEG